MASHSARFAAANETCALEKHGRLSSSFFFGTGRGVVFIRILKRRSTRRRAVGGSSCARRRAQCWLPVLVQRRGIEREREREQPPECSLREDPAQKKNRRRRRRRRRRRPTTTTRLSLMTAGRFFLSRSIEEVALALSLDRRDTGVWRAVPRAPGAVAPFAGSTPRNPRAACPTEFSTEVSTAFRTLFPARVSIRVSFLSLATRSRFL